MGLDNQAAKLLLLTKGLCQNRFGEVLILGHQKDYVSNSFRRAIYIKTNKEYKKQKRNYADEILNTIGLSKVKYLDISGRKIIKIRNLIKLKWINDYLIIGKTHG